MTREGIRILSLVIGLGIAMLTPGIARAVEIADIYVSDFTVTKPVSGIPVTIPGKIYLGGDISIRAAPVLRIHAIADLADLQNKLPGIIGTIKLPTENCKSFSPKNPVVSLSNSRLTFANGQAAFHTEGSVTVWECLENPVPNSKVDICMKQIGPIKTKVPCVHTWPGDPIKTILGTQPFSLDIPFGIKVADAGSVQLAPGEASMNLGGQYVEITKAILNSFKIDINAKLNEAIKNALDPKAITAAVPKQFLDAGFAFQDAKFVLVGAKDLGVDVRADIKISKATVKEMVVLLVEAIKKKQ